jgi:hypothetical protein
MARRERDRLVIQTGGNGASSPAPTVPNQGAAPANQVSPGSAPAPSH